MRYGYLAAIVALLLIVLLREVVLVAFLGLVIAVVLSFPIGWLSKKMRRGLAVIVTLLIGMSLFGGVGYLTVQPLSDQFQQIKAHAPEARQKIRALLKKAQESTPLSSQSPGQAAPSAGQVVAQKTGELALGLTTLLSIIVIVIVLGAFLSHEPKTYHQGLKALTPREYESDFEELWKRESKGLRHWVGGILVSMSIMGGVTAIGLMLGGIQDWPLLALLTFLGTFIPYVGAILSAIPGLIIALSQSPEKLVIAMGVYLAVHIIEGYIVQPIIMKRAVFLHPALLLLWQLAMATVGGLLGVVVATPLLVFLKIIVGYLYIEKKLGKKAAAT
jgi:predicted PurR-regulated permease PerM